MSDFECVMVDDGSHDESAAIARQVADRDDRFALVSLPHQGIVGALNEGLAHCRGELVARMDADDLMHRDRLDLQCRALDDDRSLAMVGCHVRLFPRQRLTSGMRAYEAWLNAIHTPEQLAREALVECPLAHPGMMVRRERLASLGYRDIGFPEDWDLVLRMLAAGDRIGVVPRRLHLWRDGPQRLSRNHPRYAESAFVACRAAHLACHPMLRRARYVLWGYGSTGKALRKALSGHGKQPVAIVELHPGRLGQTIFGAPVIHPSELGRYADVPVLVSVVGREAREQIREALSEMGRCEGRDYLCCA